MTAIHIPEDRIGVLLAQNGQPLKLLEEKLHAKVEVKESGQVKIVECPPENYLKAVNYLTAIAYGFNPEKAKILFEDDTIIQIIDLKKELKKENRIRQIKGRIIGKKGRMWKEIENSIGVFLSIYNNYVAIIGFSIQVYYALDIIRLIMRGAEFARVYQELERIKREILFADLSKKIAGA